MPDPRPWERQTGESSRSFGYFTIYRDLGPGRSVAAATEVSRKRHEAEARPGRPPTLNGLTGLSRPPYPVPDRNGGTRLLGQDWLRRAAAWDAEQDRIRRLKRTVDFLQEDRDEGIALNALFAKALEATSNLNAPGEGQLRGKDAADALLEVIRLRRLRRGQATDINAEVPVEPRETQEEQDALARALAENPDILDRFEADLARVAGSVVPGGPRGDVHAEHDAAASRLPHKMEGRA